MHCLALRHVPAEGLDSFESVIRSRFAQFGYLDMAGRGPAPVALEEAAGADLVVSLGGPMGVYDAGHYPFLQRELEILASRIREGRPTLGVCLGAQLMAAAAGARVYPSGRQEIGWFPIEFEPPAAADPTLGRLVQGSNIFFHWHGDTFDLPPAARPLGSSKLCRNQGFTIGRHAIALQFHAEVNPLAVEDWLKVYTPPQAPTETVMPPEALRAGFQEYGPALQARGQAFLEAWLNELWP